MNINSGHSAIDTEKPMLPGVGHFSSALLGQIESIRQERGEAYHPRTRHMTSKGEPHYTNRLFLESSPYLLQHAHNPVNWYPWGEEAFAEAQKWNRPLFVSIGYATCHWCHVMEEESFEDKEIAEYLNRHYIAVKIDREERPDVDAIYMSAVQLLTGQGGWPLNVFLTPDRKPFFGGTYFPARDGDRGVGVGFLTLLQKIREAYDTKKDAVLESGERLSRALQGMLSPPAGTRLPTADALHQAVRQYKNRFDEQHGGIGTAPKFPSSLSIKLLLRYHRRTGDRKALDMAMRTLEKMAGGGMYDHVGGGFHRYATDSRWLVPHFEKMLYDNALLASAYLEGYQATGNPDFRRVVEEIVRYVERDMTSPDGAFYAATDADSQAADGKREEGLFFTWTPDEIKRVLDQKQAESVLTYYAVGPEPNFEGRYILHAPRSRIDVARELGIPLEKLQMRLENARDLLYQERSRRPPPLRDEKILTAWNGLMISAHAQAGLILNKLDYIRRAERAARFILSHLYMEGRLYRSYKDGRAHHTACLEDYTFLIAALLDLYTATGDIHWLETALELETVLAEHYEDRESGGFFTTADDHEDLIAREKPAYDGALPSANAIAILNLLRIGELTAVAAYRERAVRALKTLMGTEAATFAGQAETLVSLDFLLDDPKQIVVVSPENKKNGTAVESFLSEFRRHYLPNSTLVTASVGGNAAKLAETVPLVDGKIAMNGKTTAYVCESGHCELPVQDLETFRQQLQKVKRLV